MKSTLALLSFAIGISSIAPYVIGVVKKRIKPERISWLLWTALGVTYFASAVMTRGGVWFTFGQLLCPAIILALSIKYGVGGRSLFDRICLGIAAVAFILLLVVDNVFFGLVLALTVDCIGLILTIRKLLKDRSSETKLPWGLNIVAAILAISALEVYSLENLLFPLYIAIAASAIFLLSKPAKTKSELAKAEAAIKDL